VSCSPRFLLICSTKSRYSGLTIVGRLDLRLTIELDQQVAALYSCAWLGEVDDNQRPGPGPDPAIRGTITGWLRTGSTAPCRRYATPLPDARPDSGAASARATMPGRARRTCGRAGYACLGTPPWNAKAQPSLGGTRASYGLASAKAPKGLLSFFLCVLCGLCVRSCGVAFSSKLQGKTGTTG
jgi:ferredoxin